MKNTSKLMEPKTPSKVVSVAPPPLLAPASAKLACRIEEIDKGVVVGLITAYADIELDEVFVFVGRRAVGRAAVTWTESPAAPDRGGREGTFRFDLRFLPPDVLLGTNVKVEIRASREFALAKVEIETARLFPARALPKGQGRLEGFLDTIDGGSVRGWVWDQTSSERRIKLHLFIDDVFCGLFEASSPRPDLRATGRGDGKYGFVIAAHDFFARCGSKAPRVQLVSLEPEFWHVPLAPHAKAARWSLRLPKPRRIPETVHEFAALLAGSEPFPKKVYLLDRLKRKMPDAFSADYLLLGLEFLRIEMVKSAEAKPTTWSGHLVLWWRQRLIKGQIARLAALAEAAAASKAVLDRAVRPQKPTATAGGSK